MSYHGNRGMATERLVISANNYYSSKNIARIDKIATPIRVVSMRGNMITRAFFEEKSTVDFVGCIKDGKIIAFDCKEVASERFPLSNIKKHQYDFLGQINDLGGIGFIVIYFSKMFKFARLDFGSLRTLWERKECQGGKRGTCSVHFDDLQEIKISGMVLDYLYGLY